MMYTLMRLTALKTQYAMQDLGDLQHYLSNTIERNEDQIKYIRLHTQYGQIQSLAVREKEVVYGRDTSSTWLEADCGVFRGRDQQTTRVC